MSPSHSNLVLHPRARFRVLAGKAVIVHQECAEVIGLNRTGTLVVETLVTKKPMKDAVDRLHIENQNITLAKVEEDVASFIQSLLERGVVIAAP